jgi:hypothetical protein
LKGVDNKKNIRYYGYIEKKNNREDRKMIDITCNGYTNKATWDYALFIKESGMWDEFVNYRWEEFDDNYSLSTYLVEMAEDMVGLSSPIGYNLRDSLLTTVLAQIDYYQISEKILGDIKENQNYINRTKRVYYELVSY